MKMESKEERMLRTLRHMKKRDNNETHRRGKAFDEGERRNKTRSAQTKKAFEEYDKEETEDEIINFYDLDESNILNEHETDVLNNKLDTLNEHETDGMISSSKNKKSLIED